MLRLLPFTIALLMLGACGAREAEVNTNCTCGFYTDDSNQIMHWPDGSQITLTFAKDFPVELRPSVAAAGQTYDQLLSKTHIAVDPDSELAPAMEDGNEKSVSGDKINGIYWVTGEWPWAREDHGGPKSSDAQADAMTVVKFSGDKIVEADVFFKARSFSSGSSPTNSSNSSAAMASDTAYTLSEIKTSELNVRWSYIFAVHEFGHVLGRVHSTDHDSIMFPKVDLLKLSNPFDQDDLGIFSAAYSLKN